MQNCYCVKFNEGKRSTAVAAFVIVKGSPTISPTAFGLFCVRILFVVEDFPQLLFILLTPDCCGGVGESGGGGIVAGNSHGFG